MFAVGVGYPIEIKDNKYKIEIDSEFKVLNSELSSVWLNFNGVKNVIDLNGGDLVFEELVDIGAVKKADTLQELLFEIENVTLIRQGAGTVIEDGNIICVGEKQVSLSKLNFEIWKRSNGKMKVKEIWLCLKDMFDVHEEDFMKSLSLLDDMDLIFLR